MKKVFNLALILILSLFLVTGCEGKKEDDKITIYLFRGKGCGYCRNFITFLNNINPEYEKYFKVVSYQVWGNEKNNNLMMEVAEFLKYDTEKMGVPFIVIGDKYFPGYSNRYDEDIISAIMDLYESDERYDVFEELEKSKLEDPTDDIDTSKYQEDYEVLDFDEVLAEEEIEKIKVLSNWEKLVNKLIDLAPALAVSFVGIILMLIINIKQKIILLDRISILENKINQIKVEAKEKIVDEPKKEVKKSTKKQKNKTK